MIIRKSAIKDVQSIHRLLHKYSHQGDLIPRPLSNLFDHVRDFWVAEDSGVVVGCGALQFCWEDLAEIRSLTVETEYRNKGVAARLIRACIQEAVDYGMSELFLLTFKPLLFQKFGFEEIERSQLPLKIWADCILCVKFPDCEGIAMKKRLKSV
jgi:amino-acid N-acetyltransferase